MVRKTEKQSLKLPRGMGTMHYTKNGTIEYKRVLILENGVKDRKTVHGKTVTECFSKMNELQDKLNKNLPLEPEKQTLSVILTM